MSQTGRDGDSISHAYLESTTMLARHMDMQLAPASSARPDYVRDVGSFNDAFTNAARHLRRAPG
ncbi:hypothetical protein [Povalibacter sp.]|uniref:hypothetical protein n=1 Tax=Povalibacter sp. TaxID=1962978 RepID=UPI002F3E6F3B